MVNEKKLSAHTWPLRQSPCRRERTLSFLIMGLKENPSHTQFSQLYVGQLRFSCFSDYC